MTGGEPTLYPFLGELVKYAKSKGLQVNVQTNATLITAKMAKDLKHKGVDAAFVNLPSHIPETYAKLTSTVPETFERACKGIHNLIDAKIPVEINFVITEANSMEMTDFVRFLKKEFPETSQLIFSVVQPHGKAEANSYLVPNYFDIKDELEHAIAVAGELEFEVSNPYCGMPLCVTWEFLPFERNSEFISGKEVRGKKKIPSALQAVMDSKTHVPSCVHCYLKNFCLGVWKKYYKIRGDIVEPPYKVLRFWPES